LSGGLILSGGRAEARKVEVPFQESIFREAQSMSEQSMSAYDMEGIKKSALSKKQKRGLLAEAKNRLSGGK